MANVTTRQSGEGSNHAGASVQTMMPLSTSEPSASPPRHPIRARTRLSVNSWRMSRPGPAPMALRRAISR